MFLVRDPKATFWSQCLQCLDDSFLECFGAACSFGRPTNWSRDKEILGMVESQEMDNSHLKSFVHQVCPWWRTEVDIIFSCKFCLNFSWNIICRFGDTKLQKPENKAFAQAFQKNYAGKILECHLRLLNAIRVGDYLPDRVTNLILQYLSSR